MALFRRLERVSWPLVALWVMVGLAAGLGWAQVLSGLALLLITTSAASAGWLLWQFGWVREIWAVLFGLAAGPAAALWANRNVLICRLGGSDFCDAPIVNLWPLVIGLIALPVAGAHLVLSGSRSLARPTRAQVPR